MTTRKKSSQRPKLVDSLERIPEVLPKERLLTLQKLAEQGNLTDEILIKELGDQGLFLVSFGAATAITATIRQTAPPKIASRIDELDEHVNSTAPALFKLSLIQKMAQHFVETTPDDDEQKGDKSLPFDDIDGYRGATTYLDIGGAFVPLVRCEVSFTNRPALPTLSLRLTDVSYLAAALLGSFGKALKSSALLSPHGLLDESELESISERLEMLSHELKQFQSDLKELSTKGATDLQAGLVSTVSE